MKVSNSSCENARIWFDDCGLKVIIVLHAVVSHAALVTNVLFVRRFYKSKLFHINIRILIALAIFANILHSLLYAILQTLFSYTYLAAKDPCDLLVPGIVCIIFRYPMVVIAMTYTPLNVAMVLERIIATVDIRNYGKRSAAYGMVVSILSVVFGIVAACHLFAFFTDRPTPYCASHSRSGDGMLFSVDSMYMSIIQLMTFVAFLSVCALNYIKTRARIYDVIIRYQYNENVAVLWLLFPFISAYFVSFTFLWIGTTVWLKLAHAIPDSFAATRTRMLLISNYTIPYFCLLSPLILWRMMILQKRRDVARWKNMSTMSANDHYNSYLAGWN